MHVGSVHVNNSVPTDSKYYIRRSLLSFDTSTLPDDAIIESAVVRVRAESPYTIPDSSQWLNSINTIALVGPSTPSSPTSLVLSDYQNTSELDNPLYLSDYIHSTDNAS